MVTQQAAQRIILATNNQGRESRLAAASEHALPLLAPPVASIDDACHPTRAA